MFDDSPGEVAISILRMSINAAQAIEDATKLKTLALFVRLDGYRLVEREVPPSDGRGTLAISWHVLGASPRRRIAIPLFPGNTAGKPAEPDWCDVSPVRLTEGLLQGVPLKVALEHARVAMRALAAFDRTRAI